MRRPRGGYSSMNSSPSGSTKRIWAVVPPGDPDRAADRQGQIGLEVRRGDRADLADLVGADQHPRLHREVEHIAEDRGHVVARPAHATRLRQRLEGQRRIPSRATAATPTPRRPPPPCGPADPTPPHHGSAPTSAGRWTGRALVGVRRAYPSAHSAGAGGAGQVQLRALRPAAHRARGSVSARCRRSAGRTTSCRATGRSGCAATSSRWDRCTMALFRFCSARPP